MDKALKQRLVGASVLIVLAVIVLPMLLGGQSDRLKHESRQIELPQKPDELSFETRRFPVAVPNKPQAVVPDAASKDEATLQPGDREPLLDSATVGKPVMPPPAIAEAQDEVQDEAQTIVAPLVAENSESGQTSSGPEILSTQVEKSPAVTAVLIEPRPDNTVNPGQAPADAAIAPRYLVQVASFSSEKRANVLAAELRAGNMKVVMDVVDRTGGRLHRVRVGPFVARSDADATVARIKAQNASLSPRVMDMRPSDAAPVAGPSDPMVRWVVQLGSFSKPAAADAQVAKLRLAGLPAFTEKVSSAKGISYKVRVGPELDRGKAQSLKRKIKTEHNIDGFVTTQ